MFVLLGEEKMKLSEKQALILFDIAKESVKFGSFAGYSRATLTHLVDDIINQQCTTLVDLDG